MTHPHTALSIVIPLATIEALPDDLFVSLSSYSRDLTITVDADDDLGEGPADPRMASVRVSGDAVEDEWILERWALLPGAVVGA